MSKIEEMAEAYGRENPFTWCDADAEINKDTNSPAIAYSDGANAVLKEIEELLNPEWKLGSLLEDTIRNKICELKGE